MVIQGKMEITQHKTSDADHFNQFRWEEFTLTFLLECDFFFLASVVLVFYGLV